MNHSHTANNGNGGTPKGLVRLSQLFYLLGTPAKDKISLENWRESYSAEGKLICENATNEQILSNDCGTVACAIGYACVHPQFIKEGLRWDMEGGVPEYLDPEADKPRITGSWNAVSKFFQMATEEAKSVFGTLSGTECRIHSGWTQRDVVRKRLHSYLTDRGVNVSEFALIDV